MNAPPPTPRGIRISDADRERAAQRLHRALGGPHFVVHGRAGMGPVRIRRRYRLGRWSF